MTSQEEKIATLEIQVQRQHRITRILIITLFLISITNFFLGIKIYRLIEVLQQIIHLSYPLIN